MRRSRACRVGVLLAAVAVTRCASQPTPAPMASAAPPPPDEGPGLVEGMVTTLRDGGSRERLTSGEGLLEGMATVSREGGAGSRDASDASEAGR